MAFEARICIANNGIGVDTRLEQEHGVYALAGSLRAAGDADGCRVTTPGITSFFLEARHLLWFPVSCPEEPATAVVVTAPAGAHPDARDVEMVERKGRGHRDSICDGLAEAFSIGLTRAYYERCGAILHHNVDKVRVATGSSNPRFGGGEVTAPLEVFLAERATSMADGIVIPVSEIAEQTSRTWFRANLHALDLERHVRIRSLVRPGSTALAGLIPRGQAAGFVASHWPPEKATRPFDSANAARARLSRRSGAERKIHHRVRNGSQAAPPISQSALHPVKDRRVVDHAALVLHLPLC